MVQKIRKPLPNMQTASDQTQASLPGNAGASTAPMTNASPAGTGPTNGNASAKKKTTGLMGWMNKSKMAKS